MGLSCAEKRAKPGRTIDCVVEAVPVVGKGCGRTFHRRAVRRLPIGLDDDAIARWSHIMGVPPRLDVVEKAAGALHVRDDR